VNKAILTVDLGYGDSGKGTIIDALAHRHKDCLVIRYNGGCQAGHNVVTEDGRHHTFSQFGSGTFNPKSKTLLSRFMVVSPLVMAAEEERLKSNGVNDAFDRLYVDERAIVTTPYHRAINRLMELSRGNRIHGSCGMGVGATVEDCAMRGHEEVVTIKDMLDPQRLKAKLLETRKAMMHRLTLLSLKPMDMDITQTVQREKSTFDISLVDSVVKRCTDWAKCVHIVNMDTAHKMINEAPTALFEGAQGVLIDQDHGFHPYTTWSNTTLDNAYQLLKEASYLGDVESLGIIRTFATRHGPGPFVTECPDMLEDRDDKNNPPNRWQREFRVGWTDLVTLKYAVKVCGKLNGLAVTHTDALNGPNDQHVAVAYTEPNGVPCWQIPDMKSLSLSQRTVVSVYMMTLKYITDSVAPDMFTTRLEKELGLPVKAISFGPRTHQKCFFM